MMTFIGASVPAHAERLLNMHTNAEPETLDPNLATGNVEQHYINALFEGLTNYHPKDLHAVPGVAEKWTVSPDGKTYTFTLRKNAKWSDGAPVTADDFAYSYERILNPKTGGKYANMLYPIKNAEAYNTGKITDPKLLGVKVKDPYTLVLELAYPAPYLLYLTSLETYFPVPRQAIEKHGAAWTRPENIVGNGPFVLKDWTPHKYATTLKSPTYWGKDTVRLDGIRFWPVEDLETALKMYDEGQLDLAWYLPSAKIPALQKRPDYVKTPWFTSEYYWVNIKDPVLKDPRVRRALAMAIDRKTLTEKFMHGVNVPLGSMAPNGIPGYTPPANAPKFDPEGARKLLAEAGITDPSTVTVEILYNTHDERKTVAQVIQQMWKQNLGINTQLHNEEWKSYLKDMKQKNYASLCRAGWVGDYLDPMSFLDMPMTNGPMNQGHWGNAKYDELINKARMEPNAQKRMQYMNQAETILMEEMPLIPIYQQNKNFLMKPYVKGYLPNILDYHNWQTVYLEEAPSTDAPSHWDHIRGIYKKTS
jgi:oligopeptide transport system substrate-binding protein